MSGQDCETWLAAIQCAGQFVHAPGQSLFDWIVEVLGFSVRCVHLCSTQIEVMCSASWLDRYTDPFLSNLGLIPVGVPDKIAQIQ